MLMRRGMMIFVISFIAVFAETEGMRGDVQWSGNNEVKYISGWEGQRYYVSGVEHCQVSPG